MDRVTVSRRSLLLGGVSLACLGAGPVKPLQFRVSIEILDGNTEQLLDRHLVLFHDAKIYDIAQLAPQDVMVIDPVKGEVTLLSRQAQIQTRIQSQAIIDLVARVRAAAAAKGQELGIGVEPVKKEKEYSLAFDKYTYRTSVAVPQVPFHAKQFVEFTDWAARVNLVRSLGPPPFGRMTLGSQMAADGVVPAEMTLTCKSDSVNQTFKLNHQFSAGIDQADEKRIAEVQGMIALYRQVPLNSFPK